MDESLSSLICARLDETRARNPYLVPTMASVGMMLYPDEPYDTFLPYIDLPVDYIDDEYLKQLAKLAGFAGVSLAELKAFVFKRFAVTNFRLLPKAPVAEMLDTYRAYGVAMGPQLFYRYVNQTLSGAPQDAVI